MKPGNSVNGLMPVIVFVFAAASPLRLLADLGDSLPNYIEYSANFASAGQPGREDFEQIRDAGFERVVYIAFSSDRNAIADEDRLVRDLGMDYVQIPVPWDAPSPSDFETFAAVMQQAPDDKTLLHCQVNFRASAFAFLYRVIYEGVPPAEARADMSSIWEPNPTWSAFVDTVLESHGLAAD